jgi:ELWxxDGT repeat protein
VLEDRVLPSGLPQLLKDINPSFADASPDAPADINGTAFFAASDGTAHGRELWRSDGSAAGTQMVLDINPGSASSNPSFLTNVAGTLFFAADNGNSGAELWRSDGSAAGTQMVLDINPGGASTPTNLTTIGGTLFFAASDGANGRELWRSDGSSAGTQMVKDINPGSRDSYPNYLTNMGGTLFFAARDPTNGTQLWRSDGTSAGTQIVKNLGGATSNPKDLTNLGGTLFFGAGNPSAGEGLWRSDGSAAGTQLVKNVGISRGNGIFVTSVANTLFFTGDDGTNGRELWRSDGTAAGTEMVADINPGSGSSTPRYLTNVSGTLFFKASDTGGTKLWRSDGTGAGTQIVKDIALGGITFGAYGPTNINGTLFFSANDGTHGFELWQSDGSAAGTQIVKDIVPGGGSSKPSYLTNFGGTLFFSANGGFNGTELWRSDGSAAGTVQIKQINTDTLDSSPSNFVPVNGSVFFTASTPASGRELWVTDESAAGTHLVKDINPGSNDSNPGNLTNVNGTLFFAANNGTNGTELWRSDGSAAGTQMIRDINFGSQSSSPYSFTNFNGTLLFNANDGTNGRELWRSDGSYAGTQLVKDIDPGAGDSDPNTMANFNGTLFFRADNGTNGYELWRSDGTEGGTQMVKDINPGSGASIPGEFTNVGGTLFFAADDGANGPELWRTDGSTGGTLMVKDIFPGSYGSEPSYLINVSGTLFFKARDKADNPELWRSDGSAAGTQIVAEIRPGIHGSDPHYLTNVSGTLFFEANDGTNGRELWRSDGSAAGTQMVADINPGAGDGIPRYARYLTNVGGTLYFVANDGTDGNELWRSDGSAGGTQMVQDLFPGSHGSYPTGLTNVGGSLVFEANDGFHGSEPWILQPTPANTTTTITASDPTPVVGETVTYTASVAARGPRSGSPDNGTVTFRFNGVAQPAATISNGMATMTHTWGTSGAGHSVQADYNGDTKPDNFIASTSSSTTITVAMDDTTTALTASNLNPLAGAVITITALVTANAPGSGTPSGSVSFSFDGAPGVSEPVAGGQAKFVTPALALGGNTIAASYSGDANYNVSNDSLVINASSQTTTTVSFTPAPPIFFGGAVTYTATVTPAHAGAPTGSVDFTVTNGAQSDSGSAPVDGSGQATFTSTGLAAGAQTVTAVYQGDAIFLTSSGSRLHTISAALTHVALAETLGNPFYGVANGATATVSVKPGAGAGSVSTGVVLFTATTITNSRSNGTFSLGGTFSQPLSAPVAVDASGVATLGGIVLPGRLSEFMTDGQPVNVTPIAWALSAQYLGDGNFAASNQSLAVNDNVKLDVSGTAVSTSANPAQFGQKITITATVTNVSAPLPPDGTVTLFDTYVIAGVTNSVTLGTLSLTPSAANQSRATFTTASLALANHSLRAVYNPPNSLPLPPLPAGQVAGSTSLAFGEAVINDSTSNVLTVSPPASVFGQLVSFTDTVTAANGGQPHSGTVQFLDGTTVVFSTGLNIRGKAVFTTGSLSAGSPHTISARYLGDMNFQASTSNAIAYSVAKDATSTSAVKSSNAHQAHGLAVTLSATVTANAPGAGVPTGSVVFRDFGYEFTPTGGMQVHANAATVVGTATLAGGVAKLVVPGGFVAGVHQIFASYLGDSNFVPSSGGTPFSQVGVDTTTKMTLAGGPNPTVGVEPTFTARVLPGSNPTGYPGSGTGAIGFGGATGPGLIVYSEGLTPLGSQALDDSGTGRGTFSIASLAVGTHTITATYNGDDEFGELPTGATATFVIDVTPPLAVATAKRDSPHFSVPVPVQGDSSHFRVQKWGQSPQSVDAYFAGSRKSNGHARTLAGALARLHAEGDWWSDVF